MLLDLDDPRRVIGDCASRCSSRTRAEREGYVPNVVYTCGAMINGTDLVLPYGLADAAISIAIIALDDLLRELRRNATV